MAPTNGTNGEESDRDDGRLSPSRAAISVSRRTVLLAGGAAIVGGTALWTVRSDDSFSCEGGAIIGAPVSGEWTVVNPPGHPALADDFVATRSGVPYPLPAVARHVAWRLPVERTYGWGRPVYAPVAGTVLAVSNEERDHERVNLIGDSVGTLAASPDVANGDIRPAAGNYVVLEAAHGVVFLAHLQRGSVTVDPGMEVFEGEQIGAVGNSGASVFPHLHLQLMSEWHTDLDRLATVMRPYRFDRFERRTGSAIAGHSWERLHGCAPAQRDRLRFPAPTRSSLD